MTARLREKCAELRVRAANLMASPSNRIRLATGKAYIDCAEEFEAILDAEGDGGAVAWMTRHDEPMLFLSREEAATYCGDDEDPISLYTHPPAQATSEAIEDAAGEPINHCTVCGQPVRYGERHSRCGEAVMAAVKAAQAAQVDRTAKDYAIEHASYLADAAEHLLTAIQDANIAADQLDEDDGTNETNTGILVRGNDHAQTVLSEAQSGLRAAVYEFRKRRDRAADPLAHPTTNSPETDSKLVDGAVAQGEACKICGKGTPHHHLRGATPIAAQPRAVPDGWVMVPIEPTDAMCDAGDLPDTATAYDIYKAMLTATPSPGAKGESA